MFSRFIGNEEVKERLQRLLDSGRMPGSLLFTGEEGIGKKLFALEMAKALNCRNRTGVDACDESGAYDGCTHQRGAERNICVRTSMSSRASSGGVRQVVPSTMQSWKCSSSRRKASS